MYGIGQDGTDEFGRQCLLARRFAEEGVRFIEIQAGGWDTHRNMRTALAARCNAVDKPIAGLLKDLKRRGLLDETIVVWGGEFGRQPTAEYASGSGRDHNSNGFTMWMAGGGIKGGVSVGQTDDLGSAAVERPTIPQAHVRPGDRRYLRQDACVGLHTRQRAGPVHQVRWQPRRRRSCRRFLTPCFR